MGVDVSTYKIIRFYADESVPSEVIEHGLTLQEAQTHCNDPETSSSTATDESAVARTLEFGPWFDGYDEE